MEQTNQTTIKTKKLKLDFKTLNKRNIVKN